MAIDNSLSCLIAITVSDLPSIAGEGEGLLEADSDVEADGLRLAEILADGEREALAEDEGLLDALGETDADAELEGDKDGDTEADGL